jgi:hypothetical protein
VDQIRSIDTNKNAWTAIVWFQGENDVFLGADNANAYLQYLTDFIYEVREEMFMVDDTICPSAQDIPVVIIQVGCWTQGLLLGPIIAKAQATFVEGDENAALVKTDDVSCHYHYDDASQLIIGERVAEALMFLKLYEPDLGEK